MNPRARLLALHALTCVTAFLLCLAGTASGKAALSPEKTASGIFFGHLQESTWQTAPQPLQSQWETAPSPTKTASGRQVWLSRDPIGELRGDGPNLYSYVLNNPVNYWDPNGLELTVADAKLREVLQRMRKMDPRLEKLVKHLEDSKHSHHIDRDVEGMSYCISHAGNPKQAKNEINGKGIGTVIRVNPDSNTKSKYQDIEMTPEEVLAHELTHAYDMDLGQIDRSANPDFNGVQTSEARAVATQNIVRSIQQPKAPLRDNYGGTKFKNHEPQNCPIK